MVAENSTLIAISAELAGATVSEIVATIAPTDGAIVLARGGAWLDHRRVRGDERVALGSRLELRRPPSGVYAEVMLTAADLVYEDEALLVVNKAVGWYTGATPWDLQGNVLAACARFLANRDGNTPLVHLAHQLDRDTSGLLLLSKDPAANPGLQAAFAGGQVEKRYLALCAGHPPAQGQIETGHGRAAAGRWRVYPREEVGRELPNGGGKIRVAITIYEREALLREAALLSCRLLTGRTHQIRLHVAHLGHPLLGDTRYGGPHQYLGRELGHHLLHAERLSLRHPLRQQPLSLHVPPPPAFAAVLASGQGTD